MAKKFKIKHLSEQFFNKYPASLFPELECKPNRPYVVFLVQIDDNCFAIPFRTNMNHKYGYRFQNSNRETKVGTGLDFTKAVVVNDPIFLADDASIDDKEYVELSKNFHSICRKFEKYVHDYALYLNGTLNPYSAKGYAFTTLKYFHQELHI